MKMRKIVWEDKLVEGQKIYYPLYEQWMTVEDTKRYSERSGYFIKLKELPNRVTCGDLEIETKKNDRS